MTRTTDAVGAYGESVAAATLTSEGMVILDRNWRCAEGELDIVAYERDTVAPEGDTIVFCEVKTRRGAGFGTPAEAVGYVKVRRLRRLASRWMAAHPDVHGEIRFDVISVWPQPAGPATVEHLRGAF